MNDLQMPFSSHLGELRRRLIRALTGIGIGFFLCYGFNEKLILLLQKPYGQKLVFISPTEAFFVTLKVSFFAGLVLAIPLIFHEIWAFTAPGLKESEKKFTWYFMIFGTVFFGVGVLFCYFVALPFGVTFLLSYQSDFLIPMISVDSYISFALLFLSAFGIIFNLPLAIVLLTKMGLVGPDTLRRNRRYALLVMFIVGAILTPPDVFSQIIMALPLIVLYEISIIISTYFVKKSPDSSPYDLNPRD